MQTIIGVVGQRCAGKGVTASYLRSKGYTPHTLSDRIRDDLMQQEEFATGENLITTMDLINRGTKLRKAEGNDSLIRRTLPLIIDKDRVVIEGIRHPDEVIAMRQIPNARVLIVSLEASAEIRFARLDENRTSRRPGDPATFEDFMEMERIENDPDKETSGQHIRACMEMADYTISNDFKRKDKFHDALDEWLVSTGLEGRASYKEVR